METLNAKFIKTGAVVTATPNGERGKNNRPNELDGQWYTVEFEGGQRVDVHESELEFCDI